MGLSATFHAGSAAVCLAWALLILLAGRSRRVLPAASVACVAGLWAAAVALAPEAALAGLPGALEVLRAASWFAFLLLLSREAVGDRNRRFVLRFALAGAAAIALALLSLLPAAGLLSLPSLGSPALLARIALALMVVLLAENLYRNADEDARWRVKLPCIALGALAVFDVLLYADAALSRAFSPVLLDARAAVTALAMPLVAVAGMRAGRREHDPPVSRAVVFHSATLVVAGAFLLGVGVVGEVLRQSGADWARAAQVSLLAAAMIGLATLAASGAMRSRLQRLIVDHFFAARYDHRREWLRCVATLSDAEAAPGVRAIRAIADPVDSPAGLLLTREPGAAGLDWAGSWNRGPLPAPLAEEHSLLAALEDGGVLGVGAAQTDGVARLPAGLSTAGGELWLAVPLMHHRDGLLGAVLLAPPRAPFALDAEVLDLLRTLGQEVALFLAERRASERLAEQRRLQDYARRFAFVAHDVKTVASQLTMLLGNAEENLQDPDFQRDMLLTVSASAARINALIARLGQPGEEPGPEQPAGSFAPIPVLRSIAAAQPGRLRLQEDGVVRGELRMPRERFEAAMTHLVNNALEASGPAEPVRLRLRQDAGRLLIDIADRGEGMTPEFIRDELFRPLATSKPGGSGIGAWQARELLREAGGELTVLSRPGVGTTMRIVLPLAGAGPLVAPTVPEADAR